MVASGPLLERKIMSLASIPPRSLGSTVPQATLDAFLRLAGGTLNATAILLLEKAENGRFTTIAGTGPMPPSFPLSELSEALDLIPDTRATTIEHHGWSIQSFVLAQSPDPADRDGAGKILFTVLNAPQTQPQTLAGARIHDIMACAAAILPPTPKTDTVRASLPGRTASYEALERQVKQAAKARKQNSFGLARLNLSHLSAINARYGWDAADFLLDEIAERIRDILPHGSFLSHMGGANFLIFTALGTSPVGMRTLITQLLQITETAVVTEAGLIPFTLAIGWAMYPHDSDSSEGLIVATRAALAESDREGAGQEHRATKDMTRAHQAASGLEQDLSRAVQDGTLFLKWMPIVEVTSREIVGHEALLRWNRPGYGEVQPELFIQCAEEAGLVEQLDGWSLRTACEAARTWSESLRVCVNISPLWLVHERLSKLVTETLRETGLDPRRLQIELSECKPFGPAAIAHREIARIRAIGVHIALDDFGQGYASLERVSRFPIDQIKLDRSFTRDAGRNPRVDEVLCTVLRLARALNISCCAKGVETEHQMAILDAYGCEEVQGFLLGAPERDGVKFAPAEASG